MCWIGRVLKWGGELNLLREFEGMYPFKTRRTSLLWEPRTRPLGLKSWNRKSPWAIGLGPWSPRIWPRGQEAISLDFGTLGWGADPYILAAAELLQSCLILCNPMDCSPPGSSVHGILQAKILDWVAISSSWGSSWPRDLTCVSYSSWIADRFFTTEPLRKPWTSSSVSMVDPKELKEEKWCHLGCSDGPWEISDHWELCRRKRLVLNQKGS